MTIQVIKASLRGKRDELRGQAERNRAEAERMAKGSPLHDAALRLADVHDAAAEVYDAELRRVCAPVDWECPTCRGPLLRAGRVAALSYCPRCGWGIDDEVDEAAELRAELARVEAAACGYCGRVHDDGGRCEL